jgi:hypothetical protein
MKILKASGSFLFVYVGLSLIALHAQPAAVQQMQNTQQGIQQQQPLLTLQSGTNAPELYPGENEDIGPQHILKLMQRRTWFQVWVDSQVFETGNALLTQNTPQSSVVFVNTAQVAVAPTPFAVGAGRLAPSVGFRSQWYNYSLNNPPNLDFDAQTAFLTGNYLFNQKWMAGGELDYTRLLSQGSYNEFYHEFVPSINVQRLFTLGQNMAFSVSYQMLYHFTRVPAVAFSATPTDVNDRWDNILSFTLSYQPVPKLLIQPYYSFEETYYSRDPFSATSTSRNDLLNSLGISIAYYFTPQLSLRGFVSGQVRESDNPVANYKNFNLGVDASFDYRF